MLDTLKEILTDREVTGMMISNIMGYGNQKGYTKQYRGTKYTVNLVSKVRVECIVAQELVEPLLKSIHETLSTGNVGDGKVFVYPVEDILRIRTGERKEQAL